MAKQKHLTKKEITAPDPFQTRTVRAIDWVEKNAQLASWIGLAAFGVIVGIGAFTSYRAQQASQANVELGKGLTELVSGKAAVAAQTLQTTSSSWKGSAPGDIAAVLAVSAELTAHNVASALTRATQAGEKTKSPDYLRQQVLISWAVALEEKQQWKEAAAKYEEAGKATGPYSALALLGQARSSDHAGNGDTARALFKKYVETYPTAANRAMIGARAGA